MVRQVERWLAGFPLDLPWWLHLLSARPPRKPKLETRNRRSMESDHVFPRKELRNSVHFTNANQILRARSCSIFMLTYHRSHNGSAAQADFDIRSELAAGQVAKSHRALRRAERCLLADVDGQGWRLLP